MKPPVIRTKAVRILVGIVVVLGSLAGAAALRLRTLRGGDFSKVSSIEREPAYHDRALLDRALGMPVAAAYVRGGLDGQRNVSFCGPTTAVDVLRSLGETADQAHVLDGTGIRTVFGIVPSGLTLDEEADLLGKKTGRRVTALRDLSIDALREELRHANDPARRYTVNFLRGPLFGRGGGHHSPIGGYLADLDLVLVLDVNPHFGPWLVPTERLREAMDTVDSSSEKRRGLLRIE